MEIQQVVVLSETGDLQLTNLSRQVLFQTILILVPEYGVHMVLPKSGSRKIENFCNELPKAIVRKKRKSGADRLPNYQFIPTIEIHKFLERAIGVEEFLLLLEKKLMDLSEGEIDPDKLHMTCWNVYLMEKQQDISIPQWFSPTCMYRLWLVFCCVQDTSLGDTLAAATANDVIRRLVELCGYKWNEADRYADTNVLTFHQYLKAIASYFAKLHLDMSLTCEVILDMLEEVVHGVLKKGYLIKKGHKRKNFKRRWFILQRNIMKYFDTRDNMSLKGQLVLNSRTEVRGVPDTRKKKYAFEVTCGKTGTTFEIYADDQKSKQQWMLAIKRAIALARVLDGSSKEEDYSEYLAGFYLLKYGISQPALTRQDSSVRKMKYYATFKEQRKRLSGKEKGGGGGGGGGGDKPRSNSDGDQPDTPPDEYMEMNHGGDILSSDSSDGSYTSMSPIREIRSTFSKSMEILDASPRDGLGTESRRNNSNVNGSGRFSTMSEPRASRSYAGKPGVFEEEEQEDTSGNMDAAVYDNADFTPCCSLKTVDPQMGGYIDVTKMKRNDTEVNGTKPRSRSNKNTESAELAETDDIGFVTARLMSLDLLESDRGTAPPPNYLTIIRSPDEGIPPIPARVKSLTTECTLSSLESDNSRFEPAARNRELSLPPRVGPPVVSRDYGSPKHRKSEPTITPIGTGPVVHGNALGKTLPPLPPH